MIGAILAGNPDVTLTSYDSLNGRVYSAGDLNLHGNGREVHNYPFVGWSNFDCIVTLDEEETGTFSVVKDFRGDATGIQEDTEFVIN